QLEEQLALGEPRYRIFEGHPHAAVPHDHRPRAVVAFRDDPLEVAVLDGVILDVDGEPFVGGVARRPLGHGPRLQYSVHLEPQVEMEAGGGMLVDDEPPPGSGSDRARWLRRAVGGALGAVGLERVVRWRRGLWGHGRGPL